MCSLCGTPPGRPHWTDTAGAPAAARAARLGYARALAGRHGVTVRAWEGRLLVGNGRGRTELADDLGALWAVAERLAGRPVDPLADDCVDALAAARR